MIVEMRARTRSLMLLGSGISAIAAAMSASPALAQDAPAPAPTAGESSGQEIIVTGVRASIGTALQLERNATQLQESIVAEDIGKLPDNNVVEALQHVSGVSIVRNSVEPSTVLIRGLPDVVTTLNGRQIFTSSSRSISLPDFPAEMLARVDVKKSPTADDIEGGVAGLIDVTLHRPFDFDGLQIAGGLKGVYGTLTKKWAPNATILASDRWDTGIGEIGALINVSYQQRELRSEDMNTNQRTGTRVVPDAGDGPAVGVPAGRVAVPTSDSMHQVDTLTKRTAINGSLQWRPNSSLEFFADYFYAHLNESRPVDVNVILLGTCPDAAGTKPFPGTNVGQVLPSGCYGLTSMQAARSQEDTHQIATGFDWKASDRLTVTAQGSYTHSKDGRVGLIPDAQYNYTPAGVTVTIDPDDDGGTHFDQPGDPQLSPDTYLDQWYDQRRAGKGHEYSGRIDANYKISDNSFLWSMDVGYRFNSRQATSDNTSTGLNCASTSGDGANPYNKYRVAALNSEACTAYRAALTPTSVGGVSYADLGADAYRRTDGTFFDGKYGTTAWVNMDPDWLHENVETIRNLFGYSGPQDYVPTQHFDVKEVSHAAYLKANFGTDFANGMALDGNIGVRVINTKLTEAGFSSEYVPLDPNLRSNQGVNSNCITCLVYTPTVGKKSDTQVLPSLNMRLMLIDGLYARLGASKTVTRPTFAQLNPGATVNAATATLLGRVSSGNPDLEPIQSTNYDVDLTYYWGNANHIGASIFYREVKGYIETVQSNVVIEGLNYILSRPENKQNATIKGLEFGYSQFLDFLPGVLSGFGWDVNATYIEAPFNNVPKFHANLSGIYEKGPLSLRLSYTYNSPYLVGDFANGAQPQENWVSVRENLDFSLNYRFSDNLTASFDATNILGSRQRQHAGKGDLNAYLYPTYFARYDRTYALGLRFKF